MAATSSDDSEAAFVEVANRVGLDFVQYNGMYGELFTPEIVGAGVALFDYDNDGDLDVYLGQGNNLDDQPAEKPTFDPPGQLPLTDRLFRNEWSPGAELRFVEVTTEAGFRAEGYNMGVATGDYDNDGWIDLYVTNLGDNQLLRNRGDGTFEDRTAAAQTNDPRWSVPASFFDYDNDGWLDLYVGNYHRFHRNSRKSCLLPNGLPDYCGPLAQPAEGDRLLRNEGDGTFRDVTRSAGFHGAEATSLGAVAADFDGDGDLDLFVANDQMANHLWINEGEGTFVEDGLFRGASLDSNGRVQASMGVTADDLDGDGTIDLFMSHLLREYNTLYLNDGTGLFTDRTRESGMVDDSFPMTGFGTVTLDYDADGHLDLFVVNGAVHLIPEQLEAGDPHPLRMENQLFRGLGSGRFETVPSEERQSPVHLDVSRGLAVGDLDNDGDSDLVVTNNAGPVRVLLNRSPPRDDWIGLKLVEAVHGSQGQATRDSYGAQVRLLDARGEATTGWRRAHTDGSFAAASDPRVLFSTGASTPSTQAEVIWPGGETERFEGLEPGGYRVLLRGGRQSASSSR